VLLDVAALKGVPVLAENYEITPQDLQAALTRQKLTLSPGDAILIHTGWGTLWGKDNARYQRVSPGVGTAAAEWLAKQDPMLVGADNSAVEISPNPDSQLAGPGHQILIVVNGIHLLENLRLDELAARRVYEFALIVEPLKIQAGPAPPWRQSRSIEDERAPGGGHHSRHVVCSSSVPDVSRGAIGAGVRAQYYIDDLWNLDEQRRPRATASLSIGDHRVELVDDQPLKVHEPFKADQDLSAIGRCRSSSTASHIRSLLR
jgi:kynurenine formamidase